MLGVSEFWTLKRWEIAVTQFMCLQVQEMRIASICDESLVNVQECFQEWSPLCVEESRDDVLRWFRLLMQKLVVIDLGLTMHLGGVWADSGLDVVVDKSQFSCYEELGQLPSTLGTKPDHVVKRHIEESQYLKLFYGVITLVDNSPASLRATLEAEAVLLTEVLLRHQQIRDVISEIVEHLGVIACGFVPHSAEEAVQEYCTRTSKGATAQSFLLRCLAVLRAVAQLKDLGSFDWDHLGELELLRRCPGDQSTNPGGTGEPIEWPDELRCDLLGWSVFSCMQRLLRGALSSVLSQFLQGLHLGAMKMPDCPALDQLLDTDALQAATGLAVKMLGDGVSPNGLSSTSLLDVFWKMYDLFVQGGCWQFNAGDLYVDGDSPVVVNTGTLRKILSVFRHSGDLVLALSILRWFLERGISSLRGDTLRPEVFTALGMADSAVGQLLVQLPGVLAAVATDGVNLPWKTPVSELPAWVGNARLVVTDLKKQFLKLLADRVEHEAQALSKTTPSTEHFIGDSLYIKSLAKKHLIEWKGRDAHEASTVALFRRMSGLASAHSELRLQETLEEVVFDQKTFAEGVFCRAKKVVAIAAAATCVQTLCGDEQKETAKSLLEGWLEVPKALASALRKVAK